MKIDDIVRAINKEDNESSQVKEASVNSDKSAKNALASALSKIETDPSVKQASEEKAGTDAVDTLMKIASDLAGAEKEAETTHAYLCGAAFADGAIAKFAAYDSAVKEAAAKESIALLQEEKTKLASNSGTSIDQETIYKQARADVEQELLFKQAAENGYSDAISILKRAMEEEKKKEESSKIPPQFLEKKKEEKDKKKDESCSEKEAADQGYNAALQQVHDLAMGEFLKGAAAAEIMVAKYRDNQQQA